MVSLVDLFEGRQSTVGPGFSGERGKCDLLASQSTTTEVSSATWQQPFRPGILGYRDDNGAS